MIWSFCYLASIVLANLSVANWGPGSAPVNAFLFIGATLTLRDKLHERYGPAVVALLVVFGTGLSAVCGPQVARIALGGAVAFGLGELADTVAYHNLPSHVTWLQRVNISNAFAAVVDSCVFFPAAFGIFPLWLILVQIAAKTLGGSLWALGLSKLRGQG